MTPSQIRAALACLKVLGFAVDVLLYSLLVLTCLSLAVR